MDTFFAHYPAGLPAVRLPVLSLPEVAAILTRVTMLVTGDTGLMHLAFAIDTPVVALFTYKRPEYAVSATTRKMVVFRENDAIPPIIPGQKYGCQDLTQDEVIQAVYDLERLL